MQINVNVLDFGKFSQGSTLTVNGRAREYCRPIQVQEYRYIVPGR